MPGQAGHDRGKLLPDEGPLPPDNAVLGLAVGSCGDTAVEVFDDVFLQYVHIGDACVAPQALEHFVAVAGVVEHIIRTADRIRLRGVEGLIETRLRIEHLDVADAAFTGVDPDESLVDVIDDRTLDRRIEFVSHAGHVRESAEIGGIGRYAELQRIKDLLSGKTGNRADIAEREHVEYIVVTDVAGRKVLADRAAAQHRDVGTQADAESVGTEVAQRGLSGAYQPVAIGILGRKLHLVLSDPAGAQRRILGLQAVDDAAYARVFFRIVFRRDQIQGNRSVRMDRHYADVVEMRSRLGIQYGFPGLVGQDAFRDEAVGVAVQDHVEAFRPAAQFLRIDGVVCLVVAQMGERHHVVRALVAGVVDEVLECIVIGVGAQGINVIALFLVKTMSIIVYLIYILVLVIIVHIQK